MTDRTIQFLGDAHGNVATSITATVNGNVVFSGNVNLIGTEITKDTPKTDNVLFSFTIPIETTGTLPISIEVSANSSTVLVQTVKTNYGIGPNPVFSAEQFAIVKDNTANVQAQLAVYEAVASPPLNDSEITLLSDSSTPHSESHAILKSHGITPWAFTGENGFVTMSILNAPTYSNIVLNGQSIPSVNGSQWLTIQPGNSASFDLTLTDAHQ